MKISTYILLCALVLTSCQDVEQTTKLDKLSWLVGNWQMKMEEATFYETWQKVSDNKLEGSGVLVNSNGDTLFSEDISIVLRADILYYEPIVSNQNNGELVSFKEAVLEDTIIRFENLQHDFPQIICYTITKDKKIHAYVSGTKDGKENRSDFYFELMR